MSGKPWETTKDLRRLFMEIASELQDNQILNGVMFEGYGWDRIVSYNFYPTYMDQRWACALHVRFMMGVGNHEAYPKNENDAIFYPLRSQLQKQFIEESQNWTLPTPANEDRIHYSALFQCFKDQSTRHTPDDEGDHLIVFFDCYKQSEEKAEARIQARPKAKQKWPLGGDDQYSRTF